ncbi:MAG: PAS domain S-box protein [Deltaproteobacteria bacterium]|nr:PAS domain S-box protein [Deltaproteobacteria bacterium]
MTFVNGSYSRFRGMPAERLIGSYFPDNLRERDREDLRNLLASLAPEDPIGLFEARARAARGTEHWQSWTHRGLFNDVGELVEIQSVGRDITERKAAEELLARSNAELQQFAYVASHDLQEPLRMVSGFLQLLEKRHGDRLDREAEEYIRLALDGMDRMRRLISDLLEYSRVRRDLAEFRELDLTAAIRDALRTLGAAITDSDAVVDVGQLPAIRGDEILIARLFQNLLGNALKFRSPDRPPQIAVLAGTDTTTVTIEVRDNGVGFEPHFAERIFTMFTRLHPRSKYEGTGIGLAVCRKIVEIHGGTIRAESEPGVGSSFFMTLPASIPVP